MVVPLRRPHLPQPALRSAAVALLLGLPVAACGPGAPEQGRERSPLPVQTQAVVAARFSNVVGTMSTLEALDAVELAAQASGRIDRLLVHQGGQVRVGQLLLVLDQIQARADVVRLRAAVAINHLNVQRNE